MKLSLNWLKDYIDPKLSTDALVERLTMAGIEVEAVDSVGGDTVLELEITPNRPDCLNVLGLAREIGAITGKKIKTPSLTLPSRGREGKFVIHIENKKDCSRYIGTLVRDVQIKDAPQGMRQRLASMGIKAINNAVDITNFVMMEMGQPLHAFDYDKLAGGKINVRRAKAGETIVTLDGIERKLDPSILVIADALKPVAIAGIMGGRDTQITAATRNILLESAHFDMGLIRRACRSLGLRSDSSYRFERNVNFEGILAGANRATDLLLQLTGGHLSGRSVIPAKAGIQEIHAKIKLKISDIQSLLGVEITPLKIKTCLSMLGFKVSKDSSASPQNDRRVSVILSEAKDLKLTVIPPSNRADIQQDVDVIEEIARMIGFDRLPSSMPMIKTVNIPVDKRPRHIKDRIRRVLMAGGVDEIITHSMINTKALVKSNLTQMPTLRISNPLNQDQELMRPVILPSFLQVAVTNINRGQKDLRFYEIGKTYFKEKEKETLGILLTGRRSQDWRLSKKDTVEIFDLKGLLERIFQSIGVNVTYESNEMPGFHPACGATINLDGKLIGILGKVGKEILTNWDIKNQDVYFAGIYLDELIMDSRLRGNDSRRFEPISEFPAIVRDVSLSVKNEIPYKKIEEICWRQGGDILKSVQFIEQYLGEKIQAGHKGLVFSCQYQSNTMTLREDEVAAVHERILRSLTQDTNATVR